MKKIRVIILFFILFLLIGNIEIVFSINYYDKNNDENFDFKQIPESFSWRNINGVDYNDIC